MQVTVFGMIQVVASPLGNGFRGRVNFEAAGFGNSRYVLISVEGS